MAYQFIIEVSFEGELLHIASGKDMKEAQKNLWFIATDSIIRGMEPGDPDRALVRLNLFPSDIIDYFAGAGEEYSVLIRSEFKA